MTKCENCEVLSPCEFCGGVLLQSVHGHYPRKCYQCRAHLAFSMAGAMLPATVGETEDRS
jgi:hypothetical protein